MSSSTELHHKQEKIVRVQPPHSFSWAILVLMQIMSLEASVLQLCPSPLSLEANKSHKDTGLSDKMI